MQGGVAAVSLHVANLRIATPGPRELSGKPMDLFLPHNMRDLDGSTL
jgi:hypothetical protein